MQGQLRQLELILAQHSLLAGYLIFINVVAFVAMGLDKLFAIRGAYRISVRMLLGLAVLGGSVGIYAGMRVFRHKTRKDEFRIGVPVIFAIEVALLYWLLR